MADDTFLDNTQEDSSETTESEKIKVQDQEYSKEELEALVEKGKLAQEIEEKQNIKLDRVWPQHTQVINEKKALEQEIENLKSAKIATKVEENVPLSPEELRTEARKQARELGILLDEDVDAKVAQALQRRELDDDILAVVGEAQEKYSIKTDKDVLIDYMIETGIKNPQIAFKTKYEDQIDTWKEQQLDKAKKPGMATDSTSTAGSKQPRTEPVTRANAWDRMDEYLKQQS